MTPKPLTAETISFPQIRTLRAEANAAGDSDMAAICDLAIDGEIDMDDYTTVSKKWSKRLRTMTRDQAYAECARVLNEALAQDDAPKSGRQFQREIDAALRK